MTNIIISYFRDKKMNLIYISLILILILIIYIFIGIKNYYIYSINDVFGLLEENRGYILENPNKDIIEELKKDIRIEKIEPYKINNESNYYVLLKEYKDTNDMLKYFEEENIRAFLKDSSKKYEIDIMKNNLNNYEIVINISILIFIITMYLIFRNVMLNEEKNSSILKLLGYNSKYISFFLFLRLIFLTATSVLISIVFLYVFHYIYFFINEEKLCLFFQNINYLPFLKINLYSILPLLLISFINIKNLKKINIFEVING